MSVYPTTPAGIALLDQIAPEPSPEGQELHVRAARGRRDGFAKSIAGVESAAALAVGQSPAGPTAAELDDVCAAISAAGYASEAVEVFENWTRTRWGVESTFTTSWREQAERERDAAKPKFGQPR